MSDTPLHPKKKKFNPLLLEAFGISIVVQIGLLLIAGSYIVYETVIKDDTQFEEAPPEIDEKPPENVEVTIQKQQPRMNLAERALNIKSVGNISISAINADVIAGEGESFQIANNQFGSGLDVGGATGNIGLGMSEINVFGVKDKGERILFLINAGPAMLDDKLGGLWSYQAIKEEVIELSSSLSAGTLFNVMVFEQGNGQIRAFKRSLVPVNPEVIEELKKFLAPINSNINNLGVRSSNLAPRKYLDNEVGNSLRRSMPGAGRFRVTQVALEQNVDLVYIITHDWGGFTRIQRPLTSEELADWREKSSDPRYREKLVEHQKEMAEASAEANKKRVELDQQRKARGLPPKVWVGGLGEMLREFNIRVRTSHPGSQPTQYLPERDVENYFKELVQELYQKKNLKEPKMNVIYFTSEDGDVSSEQKREVREFTRFFRNGQFRELRGAKAIKNNQRD